METVILLEVLEEMITEGYIMTALVVYLILQNMEQTEWVKDLRDALIEKDSVQDITEEDIPIKTRLPRLSKLFKRREVEA